MRQYETDVVVIAGGPSGLSAAVQAAESGARVIVCEKAAAVGGAANMGMGPLGIGTRYQRQQMNDITVTKEIGEAMTYSTPCSMGQNASRIALSAVENFRAEYEEHIKKRKCAADVCIAFRKVYVDPTACTGCTKCQPVCPHDAIDGAKGYTHMVFDNWCDKCGRCIDACPENAIHLTTGRVPKLPDRMLRVGRFKA